MTLPREARLRFGGWLLGVLALGAVFAAVVLPQLRIQTDMLRLLPAQADAGLDALFAQHAERGSRTLVYLVGAADFGRARDAARALARTLAASPAIASVQLETAGAGPGDVTSVYSGHGAALLASRHRAWLAAGDVQALADNALHALYGPEAWLRPLPVAQDPLGLLGAFMAEALPPAGALEPREGVLTVAAGGQHHVLLRAQLAESPWSTATQAALIPLLAQADRELAAAQASVLRSGIAFHSVHSARQARREMTLFGGASMALSVALLLWMFRSPRLVLLSFATVATATTAAIGACQLVFGEVHALTLVFGASLVGLTVDYSAHFAADQLRDPQHWRPADAVRHIARPLLLSCATAALAYVALALPALPALRQIAVFTAAGLFTAALTVLCAYPVLLRPGPVAPLHAAGAFLQRLTAPLLGAAFVRQRSLTWLAAAALVLAGAAGVLRLHFEDDVRLLANSPAELVRQEQQLRERLGNLPDSRAFVVRADSLEQALRAEEALRERLDAAVARGTLGGYLALSRALPSAARQADNRRLQAQHVYATGGALDRFAGALGWPPELAAGLRETFARQTDLDAAAFRASAAGAAYAPLWLSQDTGAPALLVALHGVRDSAALAQAASGLPGIDYVDRLAQTSARIGELRAAVLAWLAAAFAACALLLALRFGARDALRLALAPVLAAACTFGILGALGIGANLFHVLGLLLVLGLAWDYSIFLHESSCGLPARVAVSVSAATTVLGFGLLSFSTTPFIASLGLTLTCGILLAYFFSLALARIPLHEQSP